MVTELVIISVVMHREESRSSQTVTVTRSRHCFMKHDKVSISFNYIFVVKLFET